MSTEQEFKPILYDAKNRERQLELRLGRQYKANHGLTRRRFMRGVLASVFVTGIAGERLADNQRGAEDTVSDEETVALSLLQRRVEDSGLWVEEFAPVDSIERENARLKLFQQLEYIREEREEVSPIDVMRMEDAVAEGVFDWRGGSYWAKIENPIYVENEFQTAFVGYTELRWPVVIFGDELYEAPVGELSQGMISATDDVMHYSDGSPYSEVLRNATIRQTMSA